MGKLVRANGIALPHRASGGRPREKLGCRHHVRMAGHSPETSETITLHRRLSVTLLRAGVMRRSASIKIGRLGTAELPIRKLCGFGWPRRKRRVAATLICVLRALDARARRVLPQPNLKARDGGGAVAATILAGCAEFRV